VQLGVAEQTGAHITAFQQIMAEDAVFRHAAVQYLFEYLNVVNALADEGTFAEQILIDVDTVRV